MKNRRHPDDFLIGLFYGKIYGLRSGKALPSVYAIIATSSNDPLTDGIQDRAFMFKIKVICAKSVIF